MEQLSAYREGGIGPERPFIFFFVGPQHIEELRNVIRWDKLKNHYIFFIKLVDGAPHLHMGRLLTCGGMKNFIINHKYFDISDEELISAYLCAQKEERGCDGKYEIDANIMKKLQKSIALGLW